MHRDATVSECPYCAGRSLEVRYEGEYHQVDRSFGPFSIGQCKVCGSATTLNLPDAKRLAEFYVRYESFRPEWYRQADSAALAPQYASYARCVVERHSRSPRRWADVGGGQGEVANLIAAKAPSSHGTAIDIGPRPSTLAAGVQYLQADLNAPSWSFLEPCDLVFSVATIEHVLNPTAFVRNAAQILAPSGTLVIICPDYGSLGRRLCGRRWPFFLPGEHLTIPTQRGIASLMRRVGKLNNVRANTLTVSYSVAALSRALGVPLSIPISVPVPLGLLVASGTAPS